MSLDRRNGNGTVGVLWCDGLLQVGGVMLAVVGVLYALGCSTPPSTSDPNGTGDPNAETQIHVSASATGANPDGSAGNPYGSIQDAIDAASEGDTIIIGEGTYTPAGGEIQLKAGVNLEGAGSDKTIIQADLIDWSDGVLPNSIKKLAFRSFQFGRVGADTAPPGVNLISQCRCTDGSIEIGFGSTEDPNQPNHSFEVSDCTVAENIDFSHGSGSVTNTVKDSTVGGNIEFKHGAGHTSNLVKDTDITGTVAMKNGAIDDVEVSGSTCTGIADSSGAALSSIIRGNTINGQVSDSSGAQIAVLEDNTITYSGGSANEYGAGEAPAAVRLSCGAGLTVRNNTIISTVPAFGILTKSGFGGGIIGNTITTPYASDPGDPDEPLSCLLTKAGAGDIKDNTLEGGYYGIYDKSAAQFVSGNTITGAHHGVRTWGRGAYEDNTIQDLPGDGMILDGVAGPISGNTVTGNGGAGIRVVRVVYVDPNDVIDLGGGARSGPGGNTLQGNADGDLVVEVPVADAATIYAENNIWDHDTAGEIGANDIIDGVDDPNYAVVDFEPFQ